MPGAEPLPAQVVAAIGEAWQQHEPDEAVRTRHLHADGSPKYTNRLLLEASPYLRQHAHNPVNWYPWGEDAFEAARRLGRPVLLSIGYSTCHWCHVMEEESFEDEEIARILNERYVAIKVDREQRPDLDSIYMTAVQAISGRGGWPMTVWLTPAREPFFGGTYFPARDGDRGAATGFLTLLTRLADAYRDNSADVSGNAALVATRLREALSTDRQVGSKDEAGEWRSLAAPVFAATLAASEARFDGEHGGTRGAPKFPSALPLRALLRVHRRSGDAKALEIVTTTLAGMAGGGIRDHLAGGFHRYSTDAAWLVPHFEKMLYDNALLAIALTEAWQATGREEFADVAREILAWAGREMTSSDGAFFSATDADSKGASGEPVEGAFFTWTPQETAAVLGADAASLFDAAYGVTAKGLVDGRSVLHAAASADELAGRFSLTVEDVEQRLRRSRGLLLAARALRPPPLRDDKIVTAWNGLMISAAARASLAFASDEYRALASRAADFVLRDWKSNGRLARSRLGGRTQAEAFLDDYAFVEAGLLDLFEAGDGNARLEQAIALDAVVESDFEDAAGGFFLAAAGRGDLLVREKSRGDGAEPAGSSVAILNLLRLAELTGDERYRDRAERALASLADLFRSSPLALSDALLALDFAADTPKEIVLVSDGERASLAPFLRELGAALVPNRVVVTITRDLPASPHVPVAEGKVAIDGRPTAYVCEGRICDLPTHDAAVFAAALRKTRPLPAAAPSAAGDARALATP